LFSHAVEHCFSRADFRLANGRRHLDVHNHRMLKIDEIVVGGVGRVSGPAQLSAALPPGCF
jgi:hypothetical protein